MKGFKVFNSDWTCRGFQFQVGKIFEEDIDPKCCDRGFHFCIKASDCFKYYAFNPNNKVAEVEALGVICTDSDNTKCSTNKIHIIRELTWYEVLDLVNLGKGCTGLRNSGNYNSGNHNSGSCNSGDFNSGSYNSGNHNSGDFNSGSCNSGSCNSGSFNSGSCNSGSCNSGSCNSGSFNSGSFNSGKYNSGSCNSGDFNSGSFNSGKYNSGSCNSGSFNSGSFNSGKYNSGSFNSGKYNSGSCNSGDFNSGRYNSGDWNVTSFSNGCFNTKSPKIFLFNKLSDWTYYDWLNSNAREIITSIPFNTLKEKDANTEYQVTSGFLKQIERGTGRQKWWDDLSDRQKWWDGLSDREKKAVMNLPNFDRDIFKEITGIRVGE